MGMWVGISVRNSEGKRHMKEVQDDVCLLGLLKTMNTTALDVGDDGDQGVGGD